MAEQDKTLIREPDRRSGNESIFVVGTILAQRYRLIGKIGEGGMGQVFKAEDIKLAQTVALKFL